MKFSLRWIHEKSENPAVLVVSTLAGTAMSSDCMTPGELDEQIDGLIADLEAVRAAGRPKFKSVTRA